LNTTSDTAGAETSIALMPGLNLIGFSAEKEGLVEGQKVMAAVDASAIVIAIPG